MSTKVKLEIIDGPMGGKSFIFEEHDTFLFGRMPDCHACLPDDILVSRHHFIMEVNPPDARIRDLGSLNGTYVNGIKYGGREKNETPEQGATRQYPEVDLHEGDKIQVGETVLAVKLEIPAACCECNRSIDNSDREKYKWLGDMFICTPCRAKLAASINPVNKSGPLRCQKCGKNVIAEMGKTRRGTYICLSCQQKANADPSAFIFDLLQRASRSQSSDEFPEIKDYEIEKLLGVGGGGAVYLARNKKSNARVAIKVLLSKVAVDKNARKKFLQEIEITKKLRHPHIVTLLDHGSLGSAFYFIMEVCEGGSIDGLMQRCGGKLSLAEASQIMLQALDGLAYAHSKNFVHRDLKPGNILLKDTEGGFITQIADLGLAKNFQQAGFSGMTMTGQFGGTPSFMPREQITNFRYVKPVSDVWSMGATFYSMLTGHAPHNFPRGKDPIEIILQEEIIPICKRDSSVPKKVAECIERALSKNIKDRYQDAGEMRKALQKCL